MLRQPIIAFFINNIPTGILAIYSVYMISRIKLEWGKIIFSGFVFAVLIYIIRMLPVKFGTHTIILMCFYVLILIKINHIDILKAVKGCVIFIVLLYISEIVSFKLMSGIIGLDLEEIAADPLLLASLSIPSLIFVFITVNIICLIKNRIVKHTTDGI
jgi:hypothetical protein